LRFVHGNVESRHVNQFASSECFIDAFGVSSSSFVEGNTKVNLQISRKVLSIPFINFTKHGDGSNDYDMALRSKKVREPRVGHAQFQACLTSMLRIGSARHSHNGSKLVAVEQDGSVCRLPKLPNNLPGEG
jgi:hypothetical protein